jgi:hypothetical protein
MSQQAKKLNPYSMLIDSKHQMLAASAILVGEIIKITYK